MIGPTPCEENRQTNAVRNTELNNRSVLVPAEAVLVPEIPLVPVTIQPGDCAMSKTHAVSLVNIWSPQNLTQPNPYFRNEV